jgi:hypothetical protein
VVHKVVSINWARVSFSRSCSVASIERKDRRREGCAQAMVSGAATGYAYTEMSSCAGNRAVSLEEQVLFSTGRFGFAEYYWSHNVSDIKDVVKGYILLLDSAGVSIIYLLVWPFVGGGEFAVSRVSRSNLYVLVISQGLGTAIIC